VRPLRTTRRTLPCPRGSPVAPSGRSPGSRVQEVHTSNAAPTFPDERAKWRVGAASHLQWRDRAGLGPASLLCPGKGTRSVDLDSKTGALGL